MPYLQKGFSDIRQLLALVAVAFFVIRLIFNSRILGNEPLFNGDPRVGGLYTRPSYL